MSALARQLDDGHRRFGLSTFERPFSTTSWSITSKMVDVAGWCFIAWVQVHQRYMPTALGDTRRRHELHELFAQHVSARIGQMHPREFAHETPSDLIADIEHIAAGACESWIRLQQRFDRLEASMARIPVNVVREPDHYIGRRGGVSD